MLVEAREGRVVSIGPNLAFASILAKNVKHPPQKPEQSFKTQLHLDNVGFRQKCLRNVEVGRGGGVGNQSSQRGRWQLRHRGMLDCHIPLGNGRREHKDSFILSKL